MLGPMLLAQDTFYGDKGSRFFAAKQFKRTADPEWTPINPHDIFTDGTRTPHVTGIHGMLASQLSPSQFHSKRRRTESRPTEPERAWKGNGRPARSPGLEASRYHDDLYGKCSTRTATGHFPIHDGMTLHRTPSVHYTHQSAVDSQRRALHQLLGANDREGLKTGSLLEGRCNQTRNRTTQLPHPHKASAARPDLWHHGERAQSTSFLLAAEPANMEPQSYHTRSPDRLSPPAPGSSGAKSPASSRGSASALQPLRELESFRDRATQNGTTQDGTTQTGNCGSYRTGVDVLISSRDPYYFGLMSQSSLVPSDAPQSHGISDISRLVRVGDGLTTMSSRLNEIGSGRDQSPNDSNSLRLPPIDFLLSLSLTEATDVLKSGRSKFGAPKPFTYGHTIFSNSEMRIGRPFNSDPQKKSGHPINSNSQVLPPPRLLEPGSAAGYSRPAGAMLRPRCAPISICEASLKRESSPIRHSSRAQPQSSAFAEDSRSFPEVSAQQQYPNTQPGMRHGQRQTMSEAEKRARKALQQQRRRKHGPTREPRERFSAEEDTWLVMEKRRLEREPNKHWTDLEYAHKAKFPNLKDRTLSGLQSRYYRIKKKYPVDPWSPGGGEVISRWDAEVEGRFSEGGDSDGEGEDSEGK